MKSVVAFRTHGGPKVGLGHVRRCLNLGREIVQKDKRLVFILDEDLETLRLVQSYGFDAVTVKGNGGERRTLDIIDQYKPDIIVADSYELTSDQLSVFQSRARLVVVDDLADRYIPADIIINGSAHTKELIYKTRQDTLLLLGPQYLLLGSEFSNVPARLVKPEVERVLVTLGGGDAGHLTLRLVQWIEEALKEVSIHVVVGPFFDQGLVKKLQTNRRVILHMAPTSLQGLMLETDLAVSAGGHTAYELAATGTPAILTLTAENQRGQVTALEKIGVFCYAGETGQNNIIKTNLVSTLQRLVKNFDERRVMSKRGQQLVDGLGAHRVTQKILDIVSHAKRET